MQKLIIPLTALVVLYGSTALATPPSSADRSSSTAGAETSDRTPTKKTTIPLSQIDRTKSGETSDRTPSNHGESGAASGESEMSGSKVSAQQEQAYEETYKTDKAQEEQLKKGGSSGSR